MAPGSQPLQDARCPALKAAPPAAGSAVHAAAAAEGTTGQLQEQQAASALLQATPAKHLWPESPLLRLKLQRLGLGLAALPCLASSPAGQASGQAGPVVCCPALEAAAAAVG